MKDLTLFKTEDAIHLKKISKKEDLKNDELVDGYLIDADEKTARRIIESLQTRGVYPARRQGKKKIIAIQGKDDAFNRRAIETLKINYLVSPEVERKRDTLKQRDSGINHVTAKEAAKKKISFVIDVSYIKSLEAKDQAKILARIIRNIKICRKAKCEIRVASLAKNKTELPNKKDTEGFLFSLGMSSQQVKAARKF